MASHPIGLVTDSEEGAFSIKYTPICEIPLQRLRNEAEPTLPKFYFVKIAAAPCALNTMPDYATFTSLSTPGTVSIFSVRCRIVHTKISYCSILHQSHHIGYTYPVSIPHEHSSVLLTEESSLCETAEQTDFQHSGEPAGRGR